MTHSNNESVNKHGRIIKIGGQAPDDHPRRCTSIRRCGLRCSKWAARGATTCRFHGGRPKEQDKRWTQHVARFYKRHMTAALNAVVEEALAEKPDEQLAVFEEIALVRAASARSVAMYGAALEQQNPEAIMMAGSIMAEQLSQVVELCKIATQINAVQKDKYSVHDLNYVVEQIIRISYDVFKDDEDKANEFAIKVRNELQLTAMRPTPMTPEMLALQMHTSTIGVNS